MDRCATGKVELEQTLILPQMYPMYLQQGKLLHLLCMKFSDINIDSHCPNAVG